MSKNTKWELYIDESFDQIEKDGKFFTDNIIVGGILIKKSKKDKIFKVLKELKTLKKCNFQDEIKGSKLKSNETIPFIEKLLILKDDCKIFYSNDKFSDVYKKEYSEKEIENFNLLTPNSIFKFEYNKMVSNILQSLFKNKDYEDTDVFVYLDQKSGLDIVDLNKSVNNIHNNKAKNYRFPFKEIKFVESSKHYGIQIADIIVNTFFKFHTKEDYRNNNRKSFNNIKRNICYKNYYSNRRKKDNNF